MNSNMSMLCDQADQSSGLILENLSHIGAALADLQAEVAKMPFFVRGFVSSEVKKTGRDLSEWSKTADRLAGAMREVQAVVERCRASSQIGDADRAALAQVRQQVEAERSGLEALVGFMRQAPARIQSVPAAMLPPDRRGELVGVIERQAEALENVITAMPRLTAALDGLGAG
jgi:hypothetical protein